MVSIPFVIQINSVTRELLTDSGHSFSKLSGAPCGIPSASLGTRHCAECSATPGLKGESHFSDSIMIASPDPFDVSRDRHYYRLHRIGK